MLRCVAFVYRQNTISRYSGIVFEVDAVHPNEMINRFAARDDDEERMPNRIGLLSGGWDLGEERGSRRWEIYARLN